MNNLKQLQDQFFTNILHSENRKSDFILSDDRLSATQRMEIYGEAYLLRLLDALADTFPALHTLLGDEDFETLGLDYIKKHPSENYSLRNFGHQLPTFLQQHKKFSGLPVLYEMATFEWKLRFAFDAKNTQPISRETLSQVLPEQWPELRLQVLPSFTTVQFHWNIPDLWKAIIQEAPPQAPEKLLEQETWIIWRPQLETLFRSVTELEYNALLTLLNGGNFSELCELLAMEVGAGAEQQAAEFLGMWINQDVFSEVIT